MPQERASHTDQTYSAAQRQNSMESLDDSHYLIRDSYTRSMTEFLVSAGLQLMPSNPNVDDRYPVVTLGLPQTSEGAGVCFVFANYCDALRTLRIVQKSGDTIDTEARTPTEVVAMLGDEIAVILSDTERDKRVALSFYTKLKQRTLIVDLGDHSYEFEEKVSSKKSRAA